MRYDLTVSLETIEERTLAYLAQVGNPLVRLSTLREYLLRDEEATVSLSDDVLLDFIEKHDALRLIWPIRNEDLEGAGDPQLDEPCVILKTRKPTREQLAVMMVEQLDAMGESLAAALREARGSQDRPREQEIQSALQRTARLKQRVAQFFNPGDAASSDSGK